jgi:hypothetical protein
MKPKPSLSTKKGKKSSEVRMETQKQSKYKIKIFLKDTKQKLEDKLVDLSIKIRFSIFKRELYAQIGYYSTFNDNPNVKEKVSEVCMKEVNNAYKEFFRGNKKFKFYSLLGRIMNIPKSEIDSLNVFYCWNPELERYAPLSPEFKPIYESSFLVKKAEQILDKKKRTFKSIISLAGKKSSDRR